MSKYASRVSVRFSSVRVAIETAVFVAILVACVGLGLGLARGKNDRADQPSQGWHKSTIFVLVSQSQPISPGSHLVHTLVSFSLPNEGRGIAVMDLPPSGAKSFQGWVKARQIPRLDGPPPSYPWYCKIGNYVLGLTVGFLAGVFVTTVLLLLYNSIVAAFEEEKVENLAKEEQKTC